MNIFKMNDCDWIAAETLAEAKQCYAETISDGVVSKEFEEEYLDEPYQLSEEALDKFKFWGDEDELYEKAITFREELQKRIDAKETFPQMFASTEY